MSEAIPVVAIRLNRLEVHATSANEDFPEVRWSVWASGNENAMVVFGYLASGSTDGYGQAQVVAILNEHNLADVLSSPRAGDNFRLWVRRHVTEVMYDTARRALQSQAAHMDFVFTIPLEAPDVEIEIDEALVDSSSA